MLCNTEPGETTDAEWEEMAGILTMKDGESVHYMLMGALDSHLTFLSLLTRCSLPSLKFIQILTLGDESTLKLCATQDRAVSRWLRQPRDRRPAQGAACGQEDRTSVPIRAAWASPEKG